MATMTMLIRNARVMTCDPEREGLGIVERAAVFLQGGVVAWVGPDSEVSASIDSALDARGALVTPGLVDAHSHPLFGGTRAGEFAQRSRGATYLEIAREGGGIRSTVEATLTASDEELLEAAETRLTSALCFGTTTIEAKTGYALSVAGELRLLQLYRELQDRQPIVLVPTLLGAHSVPKDRERDAYVEECAGPMLEAAHGLAHAVDVYCDEGAFTLDEARHILVAAKQAGFAVRAHAGQFRDLGAAGLVAELGGLSADHLEQVSKDQSLAMAAAGTIATLLPGACVQLRLSPPPVAMLRKAGCAFAIGTDMNPGSSCTESLPLQMWLATTHLGLTMEEAWLGVTRLAAKAAGRPEAGQLRAGAPADLVVWNTDDPELIPYHYGANHVSTVVIAGQLAAEK